MTVTIVNAVQSSDIFYLQIPPEIGITSIANIVVNSIKASSISFLNSTLLSFKNIAFYNPYPVNITLDYLTLPSYSATISSPFYLSITRNSYLVCSMVASFSITLSPGIIAGTLLSNNYQAGVTSNYTFQLTTDHTLQSTSTLTFYFSPTYFTIGNGVTCLSSSSTNCTVTSINNNLITVSSFTISNLVSVNITLIGIINPSFIGNFTAIIISSFKQIGSNYYLVDNDNTFAYFALTSRAMSLINFNVTSSSNIVYGQASYTFSVQNNNQLPANSYIWIVFPPEITFTSITCNTICVSTPYNSSLGIQFQQIGPLSALTISTFVVNHINNPMSTQPSSQFQVYLYNSQNNILEYLKYGPSIQVSIPSSLTISYSLTSLQNSLVGWFNLTFQPNYQIVSTVALILTVPNSLSCPSCASQILNSTYNQLIFYNQQMISNKFSLTLSNFVNYYSFEPITIYGAIMTNDLAYFVGNGSITITNQVPSVPTFNYSFTSF